MDNKPAEPSSRLHRLTSVLDDSVLFWAIIYALPLVYFLIGDLQSRPLWTDEAFSYYQVTGKDIGELIASMQSGVNAIPYFYFVILWGLEQLVELTPLVLRASSSFFFLCTIVLLHCIVRARAGSFIAVVSCSLPLFLGSSPLAYASEARPYSLYLFAAALSLWVSLIQFRREFTKLDYLSVCVVACLLPSTHYIGLAYSGVLAVVMLYSNWRYKGVFDQYLAGSFLFGWAAFLLIHYSQILLFAGNGGFVDPGWIPDTPFREFLKFFDRWGAASAILCVFAYLLVLLVSAYSGAKPRVLGLVWFRGGRASLSRGDALKLQIFLLAAGWLSIPVLAYAVSHPAIPLPNIFLDRYFTPTLVAVCLLNFLFLDELRELFRFAVPGRSRDCRSRVYGHFTDATVILACLVSLVGFGYSTKQLSQGKIARAPVYISEYQVYANEDIRIVTNNLHLFFSYNFYDSAPDSMWLLRQRETDIQNLKLFSDKLQGITIGGLTELNAFIFISRKAGINHLPDFDIGRWARAQGFVMEYLGSHGRKKDQAYLLRSRN